VTYCAKQIYLLATNCSRPAKGILSGRKRIYLSSKLTIPIRFGGRGHGPPWHFVKSSSDTVMWSSVCYNRGKVRNVPGELWHCRPCHNVLQWTQSAHCRSVRDISRQGSWPRTLTFPMYQPVTGWIYQLVTNLFLYSLLVCVQWIAETRYCFYWRLFECACLSVSPCPGGGSVGKCSRLSQLFWSNCNIIILTYVLSVCTKI